MVDFNKITSFIIFIGLCFISVFVPVAFTTYTQNIVLIKPTSLQLTVAFMFFLFLFNCALNKKFNISDNPLALPIVSFLILGVISVIVTPFTEFALEEMGRFVSYFLMILLMGKAINTRKRVKIVFWFIVGVLIISCAYGIMQMEFVDLDPVNWGGQKPYVSFYGNKNFFGGYAVTVFPFLMAVLFLRKHISDLIIFAVITFLCFFALLYTRTRGAIFLGTPALLFFFFLCQIIYGKLHFLYKKNFWLIFIGIVVGIILLFAIVLLLWPEMRMQFLSVLQHDAGTNRVRVRMWTGSWRMLTERPILGQGVGSFQLTFPRFRPWMYHRDGVSHNTRHAHNEYKELLSETGLIGLIIFFWMIFIILYELVRFMKKSKDVFLIQMAIATLSGIIGQLAYSLVCVNLRWTSGGFIFWFIIGFGVAVVKVGQRSEEAEMIALKRQRLKGKKVSINDVNIPSLFLLIFLVIVFIIYSARVRSIWQADRLLKLGMGQIEHAQHSGVSENQQMHLWQQAEVNLIESYNLNPYPMSTLYKLGYVLLRHGQYINALNTYSVITRNLAPNYAQIHNNIGLLYREIGANRNVLSEVLNEGHFLDTLVRTEHLENFPEEKRLDILRRIFNFKAVIQFEWATTLENNQRNQGNMSQLYSQLNKFDNVVRHLNFLKRVNFWEMEKFHKLLGYNRLNASFRDNLEDSLERLRDTSLSEYNNNRNQYLQTLQQIGSIYMNQFGNKRYAYEYLLQRTNYNLNEINHLWEIAQLMFGNNDIDLLYRLFDFRLSLLDKELIDEQDKQFLNQLLAQSSQVINAKSDHSKIDLFSLLNANILYLNGQYEESKQILDVLIETDSIAKEEAMTLLQKL